MSKTIKVCDIITIDGAVMIVVGSKEEVRERIIYNHDEYVTLSMIGQGSTVREVDLLNKPRQVSLIGAERDLELHEGQDPATEDKEPASVAHVGLGS